MNQHLSKALLARYRSKPEAVPNRAYVEKHLQACHACRQMLEDMRDGEESPADRDTWIPFVEQPRLAELRWLAENVPSEDAEADRLLSALDEASAARFAWEDLPNNPEFRTGGIVRALSKRANGMCDRDPRYALALA